MRQFIKTRGSLFSKKALAFAWVIVGRLRSPKGVTDGLLQETLDLTIARLDKLDVAAVSSALGVCAKQELKLSPHTKLLFATFLGVNARKMSRTDLVDILESCSNLGIVVDEGLGEILSERVSEDLDECTWNQASRLCYALAQLEVPLSPSLQVQISKFVKSAKRPAKESNLRKLVLALGIWDSPVSQKTVQALLKHSAKAKLLETSDVVGVVSSLQIESPLPHRGSGAASKASAAKSADDAVSSAAEALPQSAEEPASPSSGAAGVATSISMETSETGQVEGGTSTEAPGGSVAASEGVPGLSLEAAGTVPDNALLDSREAGQGAESVPAATNTVEPALTSAPDSAVRDSREAGQGAESAPAAANTLQPALTSAEMAAAADAEVAKRAESDSQIR